MSQGKDRLRSGDSSSMVARDLLVAGIEPWVVRNGVVGASMASAQRRRTPEMTENETEPDGHIVRFEIIMRDGRGGVSHEARALCLLP